MRLITCTKCRVYKPVDDFYSDATRPSGRHPWCKLCQRQSAGSNYANNTPASVERRRAYRYRTVYGITLDDYDLMLAVQGGRCALCGTDSPKGRGRFHVDHNHVTGKVRGLLCYPCNASLGRLGLDDVEAADRVLAYLEPSWA